MSQPSVQNPLKLYTELQFAKQDQVLVLEEFKNLGPKTTVRELASAWIVLNKSQEWTILLLDPLDFLDSLTAKSRDQTQRFHHGNYRSWQTEKLRDFQQKLQSAKNTCLIVEGHRPPKELPTFWRLADRTVMVTAPESPTLGPQRA